VVEVFWPGVRERPFPRALFSWVGFPSCPVRFRAGARRAGRTKYSLGRMVRFGLGGVVAFSRLPLRAAFVAGLVLAAVGVLLLAGALVRSAAAVAPFLSWAAVAGLVLAVSGVQLVFLGILGEYLGAVLDEVMAPALPQERIQADEREGEREPRPR
jgi:dolichol-phosphate mannosyltransferase